MTIKETLNNLTQAFHSLLLTLHTSFIAGVQPQLIQGIRSGDGVGEGKDTIASIRY